MKKQKNKKMKTLKKQKKEPLNKEKMKKLFVENVEKKDILVIIAHKSNVITVVNMDIKVMIVLINQEDIKEEEEEVTEEDMDMDMEEDMEDMIDIIENPNVIIVENMDIKALNVINQVEKIVMYVENLDILVKTAQKKRINKNINKIINLL